MHLACDRGHIEVVRFLLSKGARQDTKVFVFHFMSFQEVVEIIS